MSQNSSQPRSTREVIRWLEEGHISAVTAMSHLADGFSVEPDTGDDSKVTATERRSSNPTMSVQQGRRGLQKLSSLVGLGQIKEAIREVVAYAHIQQRRSQMDLASQPLMLHSVFSGNPGTGKTTVARILAEIFHDIGVLERGHLVEAERADIVGEYIGHTAQKMRKKVKAAIGGVLFIDEAYSLARGGERDFGKEAIDALVKAMEDRRDEFVLILAGYTQEMEWFLTQNPGLRSRFAAHLTFPDYSADELVRIAELMLRERQYQLSSGGQDALRTVAGGLQGGEWGRGNARSMRNLLERAMRRQAVRLMNNSNPTRSELLTLHAEDFEEIIH